MSHMMERKWITLRHPNPLFRDGLKTFLEFARDHAHGKERIKCPCRKCGNTRISLSYDEVELHLIKHGFTPTYTVWYFHGESMTSEVPEADVDLQHQSNDARNDDFEQNFVDQICEDIGGESNASGHEHETEEVSRENPFGGMEKFMKQLFPGCETFTVGSFIVKLFDLKVKHGWSDKSMTGLLQLLRKAFPSENEVPSNNYFAAKIVEEVSLDFEKIDACRNDCILYWGKYSSEQECPTCHAPRYKLEKVSKYRHVRVPAKVLRYFPITPRLKRMYSVPWVAKEMTWHSTGRMTSGKMGHPVDSSVWKSLDNTYKDFAAQPRNVRLGLATDGFNPFGTCRTSYSCWPVMCVPYNLPPNLCMKPQFTMLTLLIEGPKQPGNDIDVYLQPLVKELEELWDNGVTVFDAYIQHNFNMCAALLWTIHDFPAYGNISGCKTKGKYACPACGPNTDSLRLHYGMKYAYLGFRRWLSLMDQLRKDTNAGTFNKKEELRRQPLRLSGIEVENMTAKLNVQWGKAIKRKTSTTEEDENHDGATCFTKRSILFDLKYWKHINVRHNLDVMHIEKNVCEILISLMLNTNGKTKDNVKARKDLKRLKIKKCLWLKKQNGKIIQPACRFWLRKEEKKIFFQTLRDLRVPVGFSSNWKNLVTDDGLDFKGLKSHDYHILMQHLLPVLIQHAFKDRREVRAIIRSFSTFFNALCSRVIDVDTISTLERGMARTLCELEKICPPSIFVVMMHLPIHLAYEARVCGPVYYRWMYPFERFMKTFKGYVSNKARAEGCIAARYIKEEAITYCKLYKIDSEAILPQSLENNSNVLVQHQPLIDVVDDYECDDGSIGLGQRFLLSSIEYEQARRWVLKSHPSYGMWAREYDEFLRKRKLLAGKKSGSHKLSKEEDFIPWLKQQLEAKEDSDADFVDVVNGPSFFATRYKKYCINGYLFATKNHEDGKRYQNSGVSTGAPTSCRSSAKDKSPMDENLIYYGVLKDIIELEYHGGYKPVLFRCDWAKVTHHGVKCDVEANLRLVNLSNLISSNQLDDEPFILAEHAKQVFYSTDPMDPDWHVVLEVPSKVYVADEINLSSEERIITDEDLGPTNYRPTFDEELIFNDPDDLCMVVEKPRKRKRLS